MTGRVPTKALLALCAVVWVGLVARAWMNAKGPEDFIVTVTQPEVEAFAREQLGALQERSFANDIELCAIIFENNEGKLGTSPIREGEKASCDIAYFDEPGMAPVASLHTHGAHDRNYDSEVPSLIDIESDIASGTDGYVSTPGGRLWRIDWRSRRAVLVCGEGCLAQDPKYEPCAAEALAVEYSLSDLDRRARQPIRNC